MSSENKGAAQRDASKPRKRRLSNRSRRTALTQDNDETTITVFKRLATERIKVTHNGQQKTMTLAEAILLKNCNAALQGDPVAINIIWRLAEQGGEFVDRNDPEKVGKPLFMPRRFEDTEEFVAFYGINVVKR
jgi:hypothetical protein